MLHVTGSFAIFLLLNILSVLWTHVVSETLYVTSKYLTIGLFFLTTSFCLNNDILSTSQLSRCVLFFLIGGLLYGVYDIWQVFEHSLPILENAQLIRSTFANKNLFASVLFLTLWSVMIHPNKWLKYSLLLVITIFLVLLQSKIVLAVFILTAGLHIASVIRSATTSKKEALVAVIVLIAAAFFIVINLNKFGSLANLHTLETRSALWKNSVAMFLENPFGVGSGNWAIYFPKYGLDHFDMPAVRNGITVYHQPHNDFLIVLCESGWAGLLCYLAVFAIVIRKLWTDFKAQRTSLSLYLLLSLAGYLLIAFFDFPLERVEHQLLVAVILALGVNSTPMEISTRCLSKKLLIPVSVVLILSGAVSFYRIKGEFYTREFILLNKAKHAPLVIENCDKARSRFYKLDPLYVPLDWHAAISLYSQGKLKEAASKLESARELSPYNIKILTNLGNVYEKLGEKEKATECYSLVAKISPSGKVSSLP
ncbi:MAG: lipid core-O-antigen ligase-like enyme [Bacteroidetes bacterium]|nr:lipid core-O-antigen ligase-like enyme [Bacteroidota bacterium]